MSLCPHTKLQLCKLPHCQLNKLSPHTKLQLCKLPLCQLNKLSPHPNQH